MAATVSSPVSASSGDDAEPAGDGSTLGTFGKYRLIQRIARGGMGEVFRASLVGELGFEKALVIKTILPELATQSRFIDLFAAEAKTAVALSHGNIVPIYELGRAGDTFYIVMGYVDGPSVAQLLSTHRRREHPPPLAVALSIVRGVLTGLAYAHTEEPGRPAVVHRDITPRNVMIERSGQVRIVDFGIARPAHAAADMRAGSIGYVAPEQARAEAVDPRADVFSAGCLLYELLTLDRAFPREGVWVAPDLERVPETIRGPLGRALSLDPTDRPANAGAMLQTLGESITKHAATFTEADLAAHLRMLYPDGRWGPPAEPRDDELTPTTSVKPDTITFATRLTPISGAQEKVVLPEDSGATEAPAGPATSTATAARPATEIGAERRRLALALVAGAAAVGLVWALGRGDDRPAPRDARPEPALAAVPSSVRPEPAGPTTAPEPDPPVPTTAPAPEPPPPVLLRVEPPDAVVTIDDERLAGRSPFSLPVPAEGELAVTIEAEGWLKETLVLHPDDVGERSIELRRATQGRGQLQVLAPKVPWAQVSVDGRDRGVTPMRKLELPAGSHRVIVRCVPDVCPEEKVLLRRTIEIEAGETTRLSVP
ncbi:MAG: serine/threonine protein kinase [Myxococcales bacterium]|nr:serine/threonine protein kinase [Myxococcales bacterium]